MRAAVPVPCFLVARGVVGALLPVGDRGQAIGGHAEAHEVVAGRARALVPQGQVVVHGPALVAVALDRHLGLPMVLEPEGVLLQDGPRLVAEVGLVIVEVHVLERPVLAARVVDREVLARGVLAAERLDVRPRVHGLLRLRRRRGGRIGADGTSAGLGEDGRGTLLAASRQQGEGDQHERDGVALHRTSKWRWGMPPHGPQSGCTLLPGPAARLSIVRPSRSETAICQVLPRLHEKTRWRPLGAHEGYSQLPRPAVTWRTW